MHARMAGDIRPLPNQVPRRGESDGKLDFPQLETVVLGADAALVRGRWHLKMPDGKEYAGMTTVIFRKFPEGWRIVHDHSSSAPTP